MSYYLIIIIHTFYPFQVKFCKRNPGFMDSVRLGAVRAIDECQYQFRSRRWNCSSLQDNVNKHVNLIRAHLGTKMSESDLAGVKMGGLPALPSSSVYSQKSLVPSQSRMFDPEPTINAMFNSYNTYRDKGKGREGRNSRNVRRGQRVSRSRKGNLFFFSYLCRTICIFQPSLCFLNIIIN